MRTEQPLGGAVVLDAGAYRFESGGDRYLKPMVDDLGEAAAARNVFDHGASNGYWYFGPVQP